MSHLHFDHAGGFLLADGARAFPRATIVAQRAEWEIALGDNSRLVASYDQPEVRLVRSWGEEGWADGEREVLPGVSVVPTGGHSAGHQAIVVRGGGAGARTLGFFGDLCMRPWAANPRWVTAFDDFPLDRSRSRARCLPVPPTRPGSWPSRMSPSRRSGDWSANATDSASRSPDRRSGGRPRACSVR